jgi:hypothetical protein
MVVPVNPTFPGRGGTPLEPQQFYIQDYVFPPAADKTVLRAWQQSLPNAWWVPPANAFQSWTWSVNPNLIALKIPRTWQKSLPDAHAYQPQALTWTVNVLESTLGAVVQNPFVQTDWSLPRTPAPIEQTWIASYNLNLIGQDRMLVGKQVTDLPPIWPPYINDLRTWQWSYNKNLIGKDQRVAGVQVYDLAPIYPPYINELRTWRWSYNLNLIGQDRMTVGQQVWERPTLPIPPALTWIQTAISAVVLKPFAQTDWPLPTQPYRIDQTWTWQYNLNLIGQDRMATGQQVTDLPPRDFPRLLQTWIQNTNLALLTQPLNPNITISQLYDRPQLPIPPAQSWTWSYNLNLIGQDRLPFRQQDWPNPTPPALVKDWIQQTNLALLTKPTFPFSQFDWPVPRAPQQPTQSWTWSYNLNLIGQDELPFRQQDWPLTPAAQRQADLGTWVDRVKFWLFTPFNQTYWPNPTPPFRDPTLNAWAASYNLNLIGQDRLPNRQQDWPLPGAFITPTLLQLWIQPTNVALLMQPLVPPLFMRNQDWPNPRGPIQPDRGFSVPFNPNLPPTPPPAAGPAVYNKTFLAGPGYLDAIPGNKPS